MTSGARAVMFAIPLATVSEVVASSSSDRCANTSRELPPSGTHSDGIPSSSIRVAASRTSATGIVSKAKVHTPTRPSRDRRASR
jgi:hypothetical protein